MAVDDVGKNGNSVNDGGGDMIDIKDKNTCPALEEIGDYVRNPLFMQFCSQVRQRYTCKEKIEYSGCSWEKGWNVKIKKAGKTLCTIYPREGYFTVMVVVGGIETKEIAETLQKCSREMRDIYERTKEGNGQRWLMIDLEDDGSLYEDTFRLIEIRRGSASSSLKV